MATPATFVKFSEALWNTHSEATWSNEFIGKVSQAAKQGFFYLEIPGECKKLTNESVEFANSFYKDPEIRKIKKQDDYTAFIDRKNLQCESLYLEQSHWDQQLPKNVATMAKKMNELSIDILKMFFRHFSIAKADYDRASGGMTSNKGGSVFVFHHYRSENQQEGLLPHKDFGHLTLLFINKLGLQFNVNGEWLDATPMQDYFVVNIGRTLENLINNQNQLIAPIHRVIQCSEGRISFAAQIENNLETPLYKKEGNQLIIFHDSCRKYVDEIIATKNYS